MKAAIIAILIALFATSCSRNAFPAEMAKAEEMCKTNEGLKHVALEPSSMHVKCKNGAAFDFITRTYDK